jgi:altronate dehydratase small subunit
MVEAFRINADDNVATLLGDADEGVEIMVRGEGRACSVRSSNMVRVGHKIALRALQAGERIVKYGFPIGEATQTILVGEWVHLHNCHSLYDVASSALDIESGSRNETRYD